MKTCNQCGGLIFTEQLEKIAGKLCKCNGHANSPSLDAVVEAIAMTISKTVAGTSDSALFNASAILIRSRIQPLFDELSQSNINMAFKDMVEISGLRAQLAAEIEKRCELQGQVDNADINWQQQKMCTDSVRAQLATERAEKVVLREALDDDWNDVNTVTPPLRSWVSGRGWSDKPYVLAVDAKGRMSIGFATEHSSAPFIWTFAKPIGEPTYWRKLPPPPNS